MDNYIDLLRRILELDSRFDIADLLSDSISQLNQQYDNYGYFEIYSPIEKNHELNKLSTDDKTLLYDALFEVFPNLSRSELQIVFYIKDDAKQFPQSDLATSEKILEIDASDKKIIKTFISYSSKDKHLAGQLKILLESSGLGLEVFLAHDDIEPSKEWESEILYYLERSEIFIPLITENFYESDWTGQESGIARITKQLIIPLCYKLTPKGFIGKYQALFFDGNNLYSSVDQIRSIILSHEILGKHVADAIISDFVSSGTYRSSSRMLKEILKIKTLNIVQAKKIVKGSIENSQIYAAWDMDGLYEFLEPFKNHISDEEWEKFKEYFQERQN
jgi:TIR domain